MYLDLPKLRRCCLCLPLRRGLLSVAYIYLVFALIAIGRITYLLIRNSGDEEAAAKTYIGGHAFRNNIFILIILVMEIIFNVVLIVGGHTKNVLLMKVYYYYGITTTLSAFIIDIVVIGIQPKEYLIEALCYLFSCVILQIYLILLVRSEILKLRSTQSAHYMNDLTDDVAVSEPYAHNQLHSEPT